MTTLRSLVGAVLATTAFAQSTPPVTVVMPPPTTQVATTGAPTTVTRTLSVQLGYTTAISELPLPARPPVTVAAGTRLQITAPSLNAPNPAVQWRKDGQPLGATGPTFEIAAATLADAGTYSAIVAPREGPASATIVSDSVNVLVTHDGPRLLNVSTRARIDAAQPFFLSGFVIEPGRASALVLVRAVGPGLAGFGVAAPLAAPHLRLFDASGREMSPQTDPSPDFGFFSFLPSRATAAQRVGAFSLPANSKDAALLYFLPAGSYSVQVSAADGGSGTALLEIYEVPL